MRLGLNIKMTKQMTTRNSSCLKTDNKNIEDMNCFYLLISTITSKEFSNQKICPKYPTDIQMLGCVYLQK